VIAGSQQLAWLDRTGTVLETIGEPQESLADVSISADGTHAAVVGGDFTTLWAYDLARGTRSRVDVGQGRVSPVASVSHPAWSSAGDQLVVSARWDIVTQRVESSEKHTLIAGGPVVQMEPTWSRDGFIMYSVWGGNSDLWVAAGDPSIPPKAFLATKANEGDPQFAPDGRHVAYVSDETGREEVYLRAFPSGEETQQVSVNGGYRPRWSPRGNELFFLANDTLMSATVHGATKPAIGVPEPLFTAARIGVQTIDYAPAADGKRFVIVRTLTKRARRAVIVEHWLSRLQQSP
jgi:Tol biopolymer transport system component